MRSIQGVRARSIILGAVATVAAALLYQASPALAEDSPADAGNTALNKLRSQYVRPDSIPQPENNPITTERVALGRMLFFDPRLSGSGMISCGSCHNPALGWADGLQRGIGHMGSELARHTPTILDVAYGEPYFWDGRADTLETQAKGPLTSTKEMNMSIAQTLPLLRSIPGYVEAFARAYPGRPIDLDMIAAAIATFERTVNSTQAPFDRWVGGDDKAISSAAVRGFALFNGKAKCAACHVGWRFTDDGFHDIGIDDDDRGRAAIMPGIVQLEHAFKTPTLRNINQRAPYMHNGSMPSLAAVIDHYDSGFVTRPSLDSNIQPLHLTAEEKADLLAFLNTLTSNDEPVALAMLPR